MTQTLTDLQIALGCTSLHPDAPLDTVDLSEAQIAAVVDKRVKARAQRHDSTARGLAQLAGFSDAAAAALSAYCTPPRARTLRQLAAQIDAGSFAHSDLRAVPARRVLRLYGGLLALAVAVPALVATRDAAPVCTACSLTPHAQFAALATFTLPAALIVTLAAFAPALWHLFRRRSRLADLAAQTQP